MGKGMPSLSTVVELIKTNHAESWNGFEALRAPDIPDHPIPFFGQPDKAKVLTVGVNPSWREFTVNTWPSAISTANLLARLRGYFNNPEAPPHPWFGPWDNALQHIGLSHRKGAAHLDLSPRATRPMQSCPEHMFLQMVEQDVKWLFKILPCCEEAQVIMLAGTVTKRHYMNRFIKKVAPSHGYELCKLKRMPSSDGKAPVSFHVLVGADRCFNVFFCGVSPSARDSGLLAQRVQENSTFLAQWLSKAT